MASYRFLQDAYVGTQLYLAGTTASTPDAGGSLPVNWIPTVNCDPLDTAAVQAFWNAGPKLTGLVRSQWSTIFVPPPVTHWIPGPGQYQWQLTGLGAALGPTSAGPLSLP